MSHYKDVAIARGITYDVQTGQKSLVGELVDEFFSKVRKPITAVKSPLAGRWPRKPFHTCDYAYKAAPVDDETWKLISFNDRAWRKQQCQGCYYDRVFRICMQIEQQAAVGGFNTYRRLLLPSGNFQSLTAGFRARRSKDGVEIAYVALPQFNEYFVIHNDDNTDGEKLPNDRTELYNLIAQYADTYEGAKLDTKTGKYKKLRLSSSRGWGGKWAEVKGDSRSEDEKEQDGAAVKPTKNDAAIYGTDIKRLLTYVDKLGYEHSKVGSGYLVKTTAEQMLEIVDLAAGGDTKKYHIVGEITHKCDIDKKPTSPLSVIDMPEGEKKDGIKPPKPDIAPIILAFEGEEGVRIVS